MKHTPLLQTIESIERGEILFGAKETVAYAVKMGWAHYPLIPHNYNDNRIKAQKRLIRIANQNEQQN